MDSQEIAKLLLDVPPNTIVIITADNGYTPSDEEDDPFMKLLNGDRQGSIWGGGGGGGGGSLGSLLLD